MLELQQELDAGHQAYVIAPLIEKDDEETNELNDLKVIKKTLEEHLSKDITIDILHGKMKNVDKDKTILSRNLLYLFNEINSLNNEYNKLLEHHPVYDRLITLIQELKSKEDPLYSFPIHR